MTTKLILLGTAGGPTPKITRSAPAQVILVNGAAYVFDCGNGVARQLTLADVPLVSIRAVFVTHHHSDHNADYGNLLLLSWATGLDHEVHTFGPPPLAHMGAKFLEMNQHDIDTRIADEGRPPLAPLIKINEITTGGLIYEDENIRVSTALVVHPPLETALAYRIDTPDRSIVISGDTAPSQNLIDLAQGADVLVHECIHLPAVESMIESEPNATRLREHLVDSHTSSSDVGTIAERASVKTLVLSHLVPSDESVSAETWRQAAAANFSGEVIVGHDLLTL
ncbi:MBL fold metallo-hydrolase [Glutamicibacter sp.]|jgi:Metal-dependent hydrolases of the beta-lactamase superfamily III|uniref:MBL fold metallo-hydrolase n=1 Tax=Glutamicibacter sp. TaxID=1931995 RepID=UPI002B490D25|nr:MBL fold metallo-hydrolase [Glutamicibacter sp.]HJX78126.1 MBL fold metallo-hydrolase [Glutamicibacter sp.]